MPTYWTLQNVPELDGLPKAERQRIHKASCKKYARSNPLCTLAFLIFLIFAFGGYGIGRSIANHFGLVGFSRILTEATFVGVGGWIGGAIMVHINISVMRRHYAEFKSPTAKADQGLRH